MSTYLVTGGCGFIGSHLVDALVKEEHKVVILDNLSHGSKEYLPKEAELIVGDIRDQNLVMDLLSRVDGCYHLASRLGMVICKTDWLGTHLVNQTGTITLFDTARKIRETKNKIVPILYASSCAVYGDSVKLPLCEADYTSPISAYGADKLGCELHARVAHEVHGIPTIGLRFFNVYGPRQRPDTVDSGVISLFLDKIQNKKPLGIFGDGEQTRDFIHVSDVVDYMIFFMANMGHSPSIYNVCTGQSITINYLVNLLEQMLHQPLHKEYLAKRSGDVTHSRGDARRTLKLGLKPQVHLIHGLQRLLYELGILHD